MARSAVFTSACFALVGSTLLVAPGAAAIGPNDTLLASRPTGSSVLRGLANDSDLGVHAISQNGRYVAFTSSADGLAPEDDHFTQVFVRDMVNNTTTLASRATGAAGAPADAPCTGASISGNGVRVAFTCDSASNLGTSGLTDHVYVRDLVANTTVVADRASGAGGAIANLGARGTPVISADGNRVAFTTNASNLDPDVTNSSRVHVFLRDLGNAQTFAVDRANGLPGAIQSASATAPDLDADGTTVAWVSSGGGDFSNGDVYVRDIVAGATELASANTAGLPSNGFIQDAPALSADGTMVAFSSSATDLGAPPGGLDEVYLRDLTADTTTLVSVNSAGAPADANGAVRPALSADGTRVAFETLTSTNLDPNPDRVSRIYVRDRTAGTTLLVSRADGPSGAVGTRPSHGPSITADGTAVVFTSEDDTFASADNDSFVSVFVRTLGAGTTAWASRPTGIASDLPGSPSATSGSSRRTVSDDGRRVAFLARGGGLDAAAGFDVVQAWVRDTQTNVTTLASRASGPGGAAADANCTAVAISADGTRVVFTTGATNLGALSGAAYMRDLITDTTTIVSRRDGVAGAPVAGSQPSISADGRRVAFSTPTAIAGDDANGVNDVYLRDLEVGTTVLVSRNDAGAVTAGASADPSLNSDGSRVAFVSAGRLTSADTNSFDDVFVRNLVTGLNARGSIPPSGQGAQFTQAARTPSLDHVGTHVAFAVGSAIYVRDTAGASTTNANSGGAGGSSPAISADGVRVAFQDTSDLDFRGAGGVFVRDLGTNTLTRASVGSGAPGSLPNGLPPIPVFQPSISGDGHCVAFKAPSSNLVADYADGTDFDRVYVRATDGTCPSGAPNTGITASFATATADTTPTFGLTSSAPAATFQCSVDGAAFSACSAPVTTATLADGPHSFRARALDPGTGLTDPTPALRSFAVDTMPPVTGNPGLDGATNNPIPTFTLSSNEAAAKFECKVDGGAFEPCARSWTVPFLADGSHTLAVRALDEAGNVDQTPETGTLVVDTASPQLTIVGPQLTNDPTPEFTFSADDGSGTGVPPEDQFPFQCTVDDPSFTGFVIFCSSPISLVEPGTGDPLTDGAHTFYVRVADNVGNLGFNEQSFTVDTVPPDTAVDSGPAQGATVGTATPAYTFSSTEPVGATFQCRVDQAPFAACGPTFTPTLSDGDHVVEARAIDGAGNVDASPASRAVAVDTSAPDTTITSGPEDGPPTNDAPPTFTSGEADAEPDSTITRPPKRVPTGNLRRFQGAASDDHAVKRVEIALVRVSGRVRAAAAAPGCQGLNRRGRLVKQRLAKRRCAPRTWLAATGTTRWSFRLLKRLPVGSYALFSRATDSAGQTEHSFSAADGNRVAFRVIRRR